MPKTVILVFLLFGLENNFVCPKMCKMCLPCQTSHDSLIQGWLKPCFRSNIAICGLTWSVVAKHGQL